MGQLPWHVLHKSAGRAVIQVGYMLMVRMHINGIR